MNGRAAPSLDALATGLNARKRGSSYMALCPVHADRNPSLSLTEQDGRVLFTCRAGCPQEAVLDALRGRGLWPERQASSNGQANGHVPVAFGRRERRFEYYDQSRTLLAIHKRIDFSPPLPDGTRKQMPWLRPDGSPSAGAIHPPALPLYRLGDVLAAPLVTPVFLCEGEQAADALAARGYVTVSLSGGAGQTDFGTALNVLHGRVVVLWPDNDQKGQALMQRVARALQGRAAEVRVLDVPNLPAKGDAFDFFDAGRTVEELRQLVEAAPKSVNPPKSVTTPAETLSDPGAALTAMGCRLGSTITPENVGWLWQDRIAMAKLNILEGDGGQGKSLCAVDVAARLTANLPLPDGAPNPFGEKVKVVLLMAEDDPADTTVPRILAAGGDPSNVVFLDSVPDDEGGHFPTIPDDLTHIEAVVKMAGAKLLVFDPVVSYLSADVNSHNDHSVRRALCEVPSLAARQACAVVIVRHIGKNTAADPLHRGNGSGAFINLARCGLAIGPDPDDATGERRILAPHKTNVGERAQSWAYHIETAWVRRDEQADDQVKTARIVWEGVSTLTAADILGPKPDAETRSASELAADMLSQLLGADGTQQDEEQVWGAIKAAGVSRSSYVRARKALGVQADRVGGLGSSGKWVVSLPPKSVTPKSLTPQAEGVDTLSANGDSPDRKLPGDGDLGAKGVTVCGDTLSAPADLQYVPDDVADEEGEL